jgi:hypothetical protein
MELTNRSSSDNDDYSGCVHRWARLRKNAPATDRIPSQRFGLPFHNNAQKWTILNCLMIESQLPVTIILHQLAAQLGKESRTYEVKVTSPTL